MQKEYSKILRHDFPVIPILGSVLLALLLLNSPALLALYYSPDKGLNLQTILVTVSMLGSGGVVFAHLVAFSFFDRLYRCRDLMSKLRLMKKRQAKYTSYDWFAAIQAQARKKERNTERSGEHHIIDRRDFSEITPSQIRATLHALEYHFRSYHPEMATQLEYYYSAGIMFVTLALASSLLILG